MNLEQGLRELADADARIEPPPHVEAAVMAQWDAVSAGHESRRRWSWWRVAAASAALAACAAALVIVTARWTRPPNDDQRQVVFAAPPRAVVTAELPPAVRPEPPVGSVDVAPVRRRVPRPSIDAPGLDAGYVLVPDAPFAPSELMVMRVRMPRTAFARLGVPIADPDAEGLVDVEMLVGEDGVARSIRRATAVRWSGDGK